jgi:hypothetical protein
LLRGVGSEGDLIGIEVIAGAAESRSRASPPPPKLVDPEFEQHYLGVTCIDHAQYHVDVGCGFGGVGTDAH